MDEAPRSSWRSYERRTPPLPSLERDLRVDAAIVGAGITGLTLGVLLAEAGLRVAVLERLQIGAGTTGGTTAHVTEALDTDYATLVSRFGAERVALVAQSVRASIQEIERRATGAAERCGFRRVPGYRFTEEPRALARLEGEAEAARRAGLHLELVWDVPLPFPTAGALRFDDQAQLHPLAYLDQLAQTLLAAGGEIYEDTPVVESTGKHVKTRAGHRVDADHVVDAAHTPVGVAASIQTRVTAMTSYVLEARLAAALPAPALYWDTDDPYHYVRTLGAPGERILVGGGDHHAGRRHDPAESVRELEAWTRERFGVEGVAARWSAELFEPADGLPYVGALPTDRSHFVAAGFSGTGITFGTVAALLVADLVTRGSSPYEDVYAPARLHPLVEGPTVAKENARIAWRFVADRLKREASDERPLARGEGRIERVSGRHVALYRDDRGALHRLSPRCRHLGCLVAWNAFERTWDCPCHGGRYRADGRVLYGPPTADLEPVEE